MIELLFPLGSIFLMCVLLTPLCTLIVNTIVRFKKKSPNSWESFGSNQMFQLLVFPVVAPFLWLLSSSIHTRGDHLDDSHWLSHQHLFSCLVPHAQNSLWTDENILLLALCSILILGCLSLFRVDWKALDDITIVQDVEMEKRLSRLVQHHPVAQKIEILLVERWGECAATVGLFPPRIVLERSWVRQIDDSMLFATILHEVAHAKQGDILRGALLQMALYSNCLGRYLWPAARLWREAREVYADRTACLWGAEPLALAEAIVNSLRWKQQHSREQAVSPSVFSISDAQATSALQLRLSLLFQDDRTQQETASSSVFVLVPFVALAFVPHLFSLDVLGIFHHHLEAFFLALGYVS